MEPFPVLLIVMKQESLRHVSLAEAAIVILVSLAFVGYEWRRRGRSVFSKSDSRWNIGLFFILLVFWLMSLPLL